MFLIVFTTGGRGGGLLPTPFGNCRQLLHVASCYMSPVATCPLLVHVASCYMSPFPELSQSLTKARQSRGRFQRFPKGSKPTRLWQLFQALIPPSYMLQTTVHPYRSDPLKTTVYSYSAFLPKSRQQSARS